ncbi:unnamed protein product [Pleuronectes platessa]|uniref:Uncharacterized protein n=1 Tax=Pleuronectes platessa TaxID=8262 RepID=A0A9N7VUV6_PLEPL|nr:unnamed protein product [Pleuronectes platessa]
MNQTLQDSQTSSTMHHHPTTSRGHRFNRGGSEDGAEAAPPPATDVDRRDIGRGSVRRNEVQLLRWIGGGGPGGSVGNSHSITPTPHTQEDSRLHQSFRGVLLLPQASNIKNPPDDEEASGRTCSSSSFSTLNKPSRSASSSSSSPSSSPSSSSSSSPSSSSSSSINPQRKI